MTNKLRWALAVLPRGDLGYIQQDRDEVELLFTFLAQHYERRSLVITSNLVSRPGHRPMH